MGEDILVNVDLNKYVTGRVWEELLEGEQTFNKTLIVIRKRQVLTLTL
jgi:hypothetical protein